MNRIRILIAFSLLLLGNATAQTPLEHCADQFINSDLDNAPTIYNSAPDAPFGSNQHLCYRDDGVSFFALEYWPELFVPRWATYRTNQLTQQAICAPVP